MAAFIDKIEVVFPPSAQTSIFGDLTTRGVSSVEEDTGNLVGETRGVFTCLDTTRARGICAGNILKSHDQYWEVTDNQRANKDYNLRNIFTKKTSNPES